MIIDDGLVNRVRVFCATDRHLLAQIFPACIMHAVHARAGGIKHLEREVPLLVRRHVHYRYIKYKCLDVTC